jgi:hypothetical protein
MRRINMFKKFTTSLALTAALAFGSVVFAQDAVPAEGEIGIDAITADSAAYYGQTVTVTGNVDSLVNIRSFVIGGGGLGNPQLLVLNNSGEEFNIGLTNDADVRVTGVIYPSYNGGGWDQVLASVGTTNTGMDTVAGDDSLMGDDTMAMDTMAGDDSLGMDTAAMDTLAGDDSLMGSDTMAMDTMAGDDSLGMDTTGMDTMMTDVEMTDDALMGTRVGLDQYPVVIFTDLFPDHTILVVNSIEDIQFVEVE